MNGHPREGDAALLDYSITKGPELSNPMDPSAEPTGNTTFVVDERYESPAGIDQHWQETWANWAEMSLVVLAWFEKATIVTLHNGTAVRRSERGVSPPAAVRFGRRSACRWLRA